MRATTTAVGLALALVISGCGSDRSDPGDRGPGGKADDGLAGRCGGLIGLTCADDEYCDYDASCGAFDQMGVCKTRPTVCAEVLQPVCGCDGQTYDNACSAHGAGVDVASEGACGE